MNKRIAILLYYYAPYVSGMTNNAKRIAEGLVKNGYRVDVYTAQYSTELPLHENINGVNIIRYKPLFKFGKGLAIPQFIFNIAEINRTHDIINFHLPMVEAGIASLFVKKDKLITSYICDINLGAGLINKLIQLIAYASMHIILSRSKLIISLSNDYFKSSKLSKYFAKSCEIFPPISKDNFYRVDPKQLIQRLRLSEKTFKVGFVGRIVYEKGIDYLLSAIPEIKKHLKDFKIIIAGDYKNIAGGSIKAQLDKIAEQYPDDVIFTGFLSDRELLEFYSMIDVLAFPSIDPLEAFGIVQVEALFCQTPIIASDLPGVNTVIKQTNFGYLVQPKNSHDIVTKIIQIVDNKPKFDADKAYKFDAKHAIEQYSQAFDSI